MTFHERTITRLTLPIKILANLYAPGAFSSNLSLIASSSIPLIAFMIGGTNHVFGFLNTKPSALLMLLLLTLIWTYSAVSISIKSQARIGMLKSLVPTLLWTAFWGSLFFGHSLLFGIDIYRINGNSMEPILSNGDFVLVGLHYSNYNVGDVVLVQLPNSNVSIIKRIAEYPYGQLSDQKIWVVGDNLTESGDSRALGAINKTDVIGNMLWKLN